MPLPFQLTRIGRALAKYLALQGQAPLVLVEDVVPVVSVAELDDFLLGERPFGVEAAIAPVAAQFGRLILSNLAASNTIVFIDGYGMAVGGGAKVGMGLGAVGGVSVSANPRDGRLLGIGRSAVLTTTETGAQILVSGQAFDHLLGTGNGAQMRRSIVVVPPGAFFLLEQDTANVQSIFWMHWRERQFMPQELTP